MTSIRDLKKNRSSMFAKLTAEVDKIKAGSGGGDRQTDDRFWQPTKDKVGNAVATIRFLPQVEGEELPWSRSYSHGFKNEKTGKWFIENCPTTLNGQKCPVCEANSILWNSGIEKNKTIVRDRKRKLSYVSNILVVSDPAAPENEGKVFLFRYGAKIFEKISEVMFPEFGDVEAYNPFDLWDGSNFKLKVRKYEGYTNYDKSAFADPSPVSDDDELIESIVNKQYPLVEFVDAKLFKSYDELRTKLSNVLAEQSDRNAERDEDESEEEEDNLPERFLKQKTEERVLTKTLSKKSDDDEDGVASYFKKDKVAAIKSSVSEDDDEVESYLKKLASED